MLVSGPDDARLQMSLPRMQSNSTNNSHSAVVVRDSKPAADLRKGLSREARSVEGTGGAVMEGSAVGAGADPVDQDVTATLNQTAALMQAAPIAQDYQAPSFDHVRSSMLCS